MSALPLKADIGALAVSSMKRSGGREQKSRMVSSERGEPGS
jgi:hypothetical protein